VPESRDLERIAGMLEELGENELELGVVSEEDYPDVEAGAEIPGEEAVSGAEDFEALLQDIEIGIAEEKEIEETLVIEPEEETAEEFEETREIPEVPPVEIPGPEEIVGDEELLAGIEEPEVPPAPEAVEEAGPGELQELDEAIEGLPGMEPEAELQAEEELHAEAPLREELPVEDLDFEAAVLEGGPLVEGEEEAGEGPIDESDLDLPDDFSMDDVLFEDMAPGGEESPLEEEPSRGEKPPFEGKPSRGEKPEEEAPSGEDIPVEESVEAEAEEEPEFDLSSIALEMEEREAEGAPSQEETPFEGAPSQEETPFEGAEEETEEPAEAGFDLGLEEPSDQVEAGFELEAPAEEPSAEEPSFDIAFEEGAAETAFELEEEGEAGLETVPEDTEFDTGISPIEDMEEELLESFEGETSAGDEEVTIEDIGEDLLDEEAEIEAHELEEAVGAAEEEIELTDEDIQLIKTKLRQIDPLAAKNIQNVIMRGGLPVASMNELLRLLISDAGSDELIRFLEETTGVPIVAKREVPEVLVERRPALGAVIQNLGPLVRVAGLGIVIIAVAGVLFMLFAYKPIKAVRFYREGIEQIRRERYPEAEENFARAVSLHERVAQYDLYGWEYMLAGNYSAANRKFRAGIARDEGVKNIDIRLHMAKLHNVLGEYEEADALYTVVVEKKPDVYPYIELLGQNMIDWGGIDPVKLDEAEALFMEAYAEKPRNVDPVFKLLHIEVMKKRDEGITVYFDLLRERFPQSVEPEVFTDLSFYYLYSEDYTHVRDILLQVLNEYPSYPPAHYAFAQYFESVGNREVQEEFLLRTIETEEKRELVFPWEKRDRNLLSVAFNDLGMIYAGLDTPGKAAEAIGYYRKAIEQDEGNIEAYFNLAQVFFYREMNFQKALQYYEKALSMGYGSNDLSYNLGLLYYYNKNFNRALTYWSELSQVLPANPYLGMAMGNAFLHLGKYNSALGEFLLLSELYDRIVDNLGQIKPWSGYHRRILLESAAVHNNLGVSYQKLYENTGDAEYQKESLVSLYKAGELVDIVGRERGKVQYNINYILHPDIIRGDMAVNDDLSMNHRFIVR